MTSISVSVYGVETPEPSASVMVSDDGSRFIVLRLDEYFSVLLSGRDEKAIAHARAIAACLNKAAAELNNAMAASGATVSV